MRTGLTVIALLLISALTAALIGPYYVDWSKQRVAVEAQLSRILSERVQVKGAIDLKLLPSPYVTLNQVEVTDPKTGGVLFSCDEMELALGLTSLVRGQFRFTRASFERPILDLVQGPDGGIALPKLDMASRSDSIAFDKVVVRNASVRIMRADGLAEFTVAGISLDAEAGSLLGPFKGSGEAPGPGGAKLAFNFATGAVEGDNLRFKAAIDARGGLPRSEFDGALALTDATATAGVAVVGYSGAATFSGLIKGADAPTPWRASGALKADLRRASLDNLDVRLGQEDRALAANGSAQMEFGAPPRASIVLAAKQLNFDTLLRGEGEDSASPAKAYGALSAALAGLGIESAPPVALSVELETPAAILGGDTIADVTFSVNVDPSAPTGVKLEASPPGRSHILASGVVDAGPAPGFKGRMDARIGDIQRLRDWLTLGAPDLSARLAAVSEVLPYRSASAIGDVDLSATGFVARNLSLALERSTFTGTLALTRAVGVERGRMFMDMQTDSLDIDALPNVSASTNFLSDIDLSLALDAHAIRIARLGEARVEGGSLTLKLTKQGDDVRLDHLSIADLGGASVEANGASDGKGRWLSAKIDAARLRDFALLIRRVAPGPISDMLVDRSGALSPAKLTFNAQSSAPSKGVADATDTLTMQGTAGVTRVDAKFDRAAGDANTLSATVSLDAPDAAPLLRQIGLPALSLAGQGRGHIGASAHGRWSDGLEGDISASFAGADLAWRGRLSYKASDVDGALVRGLASVKAANSMPLLAVLGIASPDSTVAIPTDLLADIAWRDKRLSFSQLQGTIGHTRFSGDLTYWPASVQPGPTIPADPDVALAQAVAGENSAAPAAQLTGALQADRLSLSALIGLALGAPQSAKAGAFWSDAKFSAGLVNPPSADIALKVAALDVTDSLLAHDAGMQLKLGRGLVSLDDLSMNVAGGALAGRATIRRDGPNASVSGQVSTEPIALDRPNFAGQVSGSMDFASTGQSASALVAGLAGAGQIKLQGARIPHLDQSAIGRIVEKAQSSDYAIDPPNINRAFELEFNKQALRVGDANASLSLTAGIIRFGPFEVRDSRDEAALQANFDLRSFILEIYAAFAELQTPKYWSGAPPAINVVLRGPIDALVREVDSGLFVAGLAAQSIARETNRIAALESDIRERAFFNRRLKASQSMRRRELELEAYSIEQARLKSEDNRARVEAETVKADEERRRAAAAEQLSTPAPAPNNPTQSSTNPMPPLPRPPSALQQSDPTASGLY
ncbi:AsmA-like C-terminal region-containing protein [Methylocapsa sp. S129]|uniref:AsmA-like C-terminal region-containing protein n=1 Tax=Methylocapsa sp. S129 TaxID=1641869 RepID=UPI00131DFC2B|nr:AsmA-like C-terminal region-containing protein [Methylocapsa sp. S129]